jgi:type VI secretion system protein ImpH
MAPHGRRPAAALSETLVREACRFDFFQAVRLLERLQAGRSGAPAEALAAVAFRGQISQSFPPSDVVAIEGIDGDGPAVLTAAHVSLGGAHGPLPPPYTARALARERRRDHALRDFLDIFNDRLARLLFLARRRARPALQAEPPWSQPIARMLLAVLGLATDGLRGRLAMPDRALLRHAGLLARRPRGLHALERLLADYFGVGCTIRPFVGRWRPLEPEDRTRLGGANARLGAGAVLGGRVWHDAGGVEITLGPLGRVLFADLLPGGRCHPLLAGLIDFVLERRFDVVLRLCLRPQQTPRLELAREAAARLGFTSWLGRSTASQATARLVLTRGLA